MRGTFARPVAHVADRPLGAVADMVCALTRTITCLDRQPPEDVPRYLEIRTTLLNQSRNFLELTLDPAAVDPASAVFAKKAKEFVRQACLFRSFC